MGEGVQREAADGGVPGEVPRLGLLSGLLLFTLMSFTISGFRLRLLFRGGGLLRRRFLRVRVRREDGVGHVLRVQPLDREGTGLHVVVGDFDLGQRHAVDEGPDAHETLLDHLRIRLLEEAFIVEIVFEHVADFAELDVEPGAVVGAPLGDERI